MSDMKTWIALALLTQVLTGRTQNIKPRASTTPRRTTGHTELSAVIGSPLPIEGLTAVEAHYHGMNASVIYDLLHGGLGLIKPSEYETKAQFDARIEKVKSLTLFGSHKVGDQYTFAVGGVWQGEGSVSKAGGGSLAYLRGAIETSYNAELQVLTVTIPSVTGVSSGLDHTSFGWSYSSHTTGHHVGQNAYGVKKTIADGVSLKHTLEVDLADIVWLKSYCKQEYNTDIQCQISLPAAKAQMLDRDVRVAFGATLKEPYTKEETGTETATIDSPFETYEVQRGLFIAPNQIVVYSGRTGEIVAQYSNEAFQKDYPLHVEISENMVPDWNDPLCTGRFVRDASIHFDYQVDNGKKITALKPTEPIRLQAKDSVTVFVPFCLIPRLSVMRDGVPYQLTCEKQSRFALNTSKCEAIGISSVSGKN